MKTLNIGILAHVDAGKTTLTEELLFLGGAVRKKGSVDSGTAATDFTEIEKSRKISVNSSVVSFNHGDACVNIIDTPGHADFAAEVERSLMVLDAAVMVVSAVEGIQAQTELLFDALENMQTPTVIFINKIDRAGSNCAKTANLLKKKFGKAAVLFNKPLHEESRNCQIEPTENSELVELFCEQDDDLMEKYLSNIQINQAEIANKIKPAFAKRELIPIFCGSAAFDIGVAELLDFICSYASAPSECENLAGIVYKITHDELNGKIAHIRLFGGSLKPRDTLILGGAEEKITQVRRYNGAKFEQESIAKAGEIAALCGIKNAKIGDIIGEYCPKAAKSLAVPVLRVNARASTAQELPQLQRALAELAEENPLLGAEYIAETGQIELNITGQIQLEVIEFLLKTRYNLAVNFEQAGVIYRETPTKTGIGIERYTMPKPCWAVVELEISPLGRGEGYKFSAEVPNDRLFYRYQNHVKIAAEEALKQGIFNWQAVDLAVKLIGGEHHIEHTHPLDFFLATPIAVMRALQNCDETLLEPIQTMKIIAPEETAGKIIGDIISMRGTFDSPVISGGKVNIEAQIPVATSMDYGMRLANISAGKAALSTRFFGYQPCPIGIGTTAPRHGVNPLDRDKWILTKRGAI